MDESLAAWFLRNVKLEFDTPPEEPLPQTSEKREEKPKNEGMKRATFSEWQLQVLKNRFMQSRYLKKGERVALAALLQLDQRVVKNWFQNQRYRQNKLALEEQRNHLMPPLGSNSSYASLNTPQTSYGSPSVPPAQLFPLMAQLAPSPAELAYSPAQITSSPAQVAFPPAPITDSSALLTTSTKTHSFFLQPYDAATSLAMLEELLKVNGA